MISIIVGFEVAMLVILGTLIASIAGLRPVGRTLVALETLAFMVLAILPAPRVHRSHTPRHA